MASDTSQYLPKNLVPNLCKDEIINWSFESGLKAFIYQGVEKINPRTVFLNGYSTKAIL